MRATRFLRILAAVLLAIHGVFPGSGGAQPGSSSHVLSGQAVVSYVDETDSPLQAPGISRVVAWATERYRLAGIGLPVATITFHRGQSACSGLDGFHTWSDGRHRIAICVGGTLQRERTALHELAHAWIADHLDDRGRDAFVSRRGLDQWNDPADDWASRGTEQAAMIVAWGLDETCDTPRDLTGESRQSLRIEYERLTGRAPICSRRLVDPRAG